MRFVDEYRDPTMARALVAQITDLAGDDVVKLMEVCGGHTHTIYRHGIELLGSVPWSDAVIDADTRGVPVLDAVPEDAAILAIGALAEQLLGPSRLERQGAS